MGQHQLVFSNGSNIPTGPVQLQDTIRTASPGGFIQYGFYSNGNTNYNTGEIPPNWYTPTTSNIGASYWIRATTWGTLGDPINGTMNTWLSLSTSRYWDSNPYPDPVQVFSMKIEIATDSNGNNIVASAHYSGYPA